MSKTKCIFENIYDYIQRGYTDEQIEQTTKYDIKWIKDMRERMKSDGSN